MTNKLKVFRNSIFLTINPIFMSVVTLFVIGYMARKMGTSDFGIFNFAIAFVTLFYPVAQMGLNVVMNRDLSTLDDKSGYVDRIITLRALSILTTTVIIAGAISLLRYPARTTFAVYTACFIFAFQSMGEALGNIYNALERMEFSALQSLVAGLSLTAGSVIVLYYGFGLYTVLGVYAAGQIIGIAVSLFILFRLFFGLRLKFDWAFIIKRFREGSHFCSLTIMWFIMSRADVIILSKNVSTAQLGLYTAAMMLVSRLNVIPASVSNSLLPAMSSLYAQGKIDEISDLLCSFLMKLSVVVLPGVLVVYVYSDKIMQLIFGKAFQHGSILLGMGIFSFLLYCIASMEYATLAATHKQKQMNVVYLIGTIFCITANIILIHYFASIGAVCAVIATQFLLGLLLFRYSWQYIKIGLNYSDLLKLILLNGGVLLLLLQFHGYNMFLVVPLIGCVYLIGTHASGILKYNDILAMRRLLSSH